MSFDVDCNNLHEYPLSVKKKILYMDLLYEILCARLILKFKKFIQFDESVIII